MPIPTDTYWNIKRLNVVFALSAVVLFAVTAWAILQDHNKDWRIPQRHARVWEAALVDDRIRRQRTPEHEQAVAQLQEQIDAKQNELNTRNQSYQSLLDQRARIESDRSTLEFRLNNLKSNVQVAQAGLQDAITAGDVVRVEQIKADLEPQRRQVDEWSEQMAGYASQLAEIRERLAAETAQLDALRKQHAQLTSDIDTLNKKLDALMPRDPIAKVSGAMRDAPLLGFVNPSEKVQQIVLPDVQTDVSFMKITTIDRCTTCHINIAKKDFTETNIIAYLEEQVATARKYNLPLTAGTRATDPSATIAKPGPVALMEFWHHWAVRAAPAVMTRNNARIAAIGRVVGSGTGKFVTVQYDGEDQTEFKFDPAATDPAIVEKQNDTLLAIVEALFRWQKSDVKTTRGKAVAAIAASADERPVNTARNIALRYPEELFNGLKSTLDGKEWDLLIDRYRYALTTELNGFRKAEGRPQLDPSPVLLAHPRMDLYVDVDSPHSFEAVGCTSCHDGSGQETDFVLSAHMARDIYVDSQTGLPVLPSQLSRPPETHHDENLSSMLAAALHEPGIHFEHAAQPSHTNASESAADLSYVDPVTGRQGKALKQLDYWIKTYEPKAPRSFRLVYHEWDWPMRAPDFIQINCARCHTDVYDIKETAPVLYEGRQLFTNLGCVNCHQMDSIPADQNRQVGTDLRHVTSKLSKEYINTWIWAPKAFRPTTKMPHFFMLENNSSDEEIRRTRQEALAMTEYLVRNATPLPPKHPLPAGTQGSADAGKALFNTIGCLACHQNLNERGQEWITTDLVKRAGLKAEDAAAEYEKMTYNQRQLYVQQHLSEPPAYATSTTYPDGTPKPQFVQIGPELSAIGTKLLAGRTTEQAARWLFDWLKEPNHYSDYTIMPRLRLSDQEALDLVAYLLAQQRTTSDPDDKWSAGLTSPDSQKLIELTALQLRSRFSVKGAQEKADDDAELTALATAALTTSVRTREQAQAEAASMNKDEKRLVFLGQKLIAHYGCMSCHAINGMETASSPCTNLSDWGQKGIDKLDFGYVDHHKQESLPPTSEVMLVNALAAEAGNLAYEPIAGRQIAKPVEVAWPHVGHNRNEWIIQKLKNTRVYDRGRALLEPSADDPGKPYDKLKMPTFYLNDEQIHAIVTFVLSNRNRLISPTLAQRALDSEARTIARGRELVERFNCIGCHQVEKNVPPIQQYFKREDVMTKAPPSLRGEGNKVQHGWLFNFFKHVEPLRPLIFDGIRMPSFPASDEDWTAIIAYFNAVSNKESAELARRVDPVIKYVDSSRQATTQPSSDPTAAEPGDDWWQQRDFTAAAQYLKEWGLQYGHIRPIEVGPTATPEDLRKVYKTLLFKARFTRQLYDSPFPFVDSPRPEMTEAQFKLGEALFYEMQCLKCHVLGDPNIEGANKTPTAPNLSLTQRRLQRRWVQHWVQEPNIIQVGTSMPPFFTGLPIFRIEGQTWPKSQGAQPAEVERVESTYGNTVQQQTDLVLDFLYAAGVRGHTGVQPATAAPTTQASNSNSSDGYVKMSP